MGFTRLELILVELQEWVEGLIQIFFWAIVMICAAGVGLLIGAFALIFAFWESRVTVALLEMGVFALVVMGAMYMLMRRLRMQRSLLVATLAEFAKDRELFKRPHNPDGPSVSPVSPVSPVPAVPPEAPPL